MKKEDRPKFLQVMTASSVVFSKPITDDFIRIYWGALEKYDISDIERAFSECLVTCRFFPVPAEIIGKMPISVASKHISADEAWAKCVYAFDENETVVLTTVMLEAVAAASSVWDDRNHTPARMAFRAAYDRLIASNPPVEYKASYGHCPARRIDAVKAAVDQGLLPVSRLESIGFEVRPSLENLNTTLQLAAVNGVKVNPRQHLLSKLDELKKNTFIGDQSQENDRVNAEIAKQAKQRIEFEEKRQAAIDAVALKVGGQL